MISVVISTFNEPIEYIKKAIESIIRQTFNDFELIIVVDNPDNIDLISFLSRLQSKDDRVLVHVNDHNMGLPNSLNIAIGLSKGEYIARMDADDISLPDRLEKQINYLKKNGVDLVGSNIEYIDIKGYAINGVSCFPTKTKRIIDYLKIASPVPHPTWLVKKQILVDVGGYRGYSTSQDYELLTRLVLRGYQIANVPEVLLQYRINPEGITSSKRILQKMIKYFVRKNYIKSQESMYDDFCLYIESEEGKKQYGILCDYYRVLNKIKRYRNERNFFLFLCYSIGLFFLYKECRRSLLDLLKIKTMHLLYRNDYT